MRILALDQSETSTGYAVWGPEDAKVHSGFKQLGSEYTSPGLVFAKLHELMSDLHAVGSIDAVFYETPRHLSGWNQQSNANAHLLLVGLAAHIESWCAAMAIRPPRSVNMATWRRHFLGPMGRNKKSPDLKDMAMQRARQLGFKPLRHDEAEAIGILDFACDALKLRPYWIEDEVLRAPLGVA